MTTATRRIASRLNFFANGGPLYDHQDVAAYTVLNRSEFIGGFTSNIRLRFQTWGRSIEAN